MTSKPYIVFRCPRCKEPRYAPATNKTATCLKCGYQINLRKIHPIARARTIREASLLLRAYKDARIPQGLHALFKQKS